MGIHYCDFLWGILMGKSYGDVLWGFLKWISNELSWAGQAWLGWADVLSHKKANGHLPIAHPQYERLNCMKCNIGRRLGTR